MVKAFLDFDRDLDSIQATISEGNELLYSKLFLQWIHHHALPKNMSRMHLKKSSDWSCDQKKIFTWIAHWDKWFGANWIKKILNWNIENIAKESKSEWGIWFESKVFEFVGWGLGCATFWKINWFDNFKILNQNITISRMGANRSCYTKL